jgi:diguanylate cyclase (GGDEF) domain
MGKQKNDLPFKTAIVLCIVLLTLTTVVQIVFSLNAYKKSIQFEEKFLKDTVNNAIVNISEKKKEAEADFKASGISYTAADVKKKVTDEFREEVYQYSFEDDGYIWINEVLNYDGGDDYGIRVIHANLKDTEGTYLSTNTKDAKGDTPYLTELQGIKENGEILYSYYFKELNSDKISKKLTYAKLYPDYNWIVCCGIYYNAVNGSGIMGSVAYRSLITAGYVISISGLLVLVLYAGKQRKLSAMTADTLQIKVDYDALTNASSRVYGTRLLNQLLKEYHQGTANILIGIFDIDNFKQFNDTYGHAFGDEVLKGVVENVSSVIRSRDCLIRWGGDEFIIVWQGVSDANINKVVAKVNEAVRCEKYMDPETKQYTSVTVSIGAGRFNPEDQRIDDILKRIDAVMYVAKRQKNTFRIAK